MAGAHADWFRSECPDLLGLVRVVHPADQRQGGHERDLVRSRLYADESFRFPFPSSSNRNAATTGSGAPIEFLNGNEGGSFNCR